MPRLVTCRTLLPLMLFAFVAGAVPAAADPITFDETWFFEDANSFGSETPATQPTNYPTGNGNSAIRIQMTVDDPTFTGVTVSAIDLSQDSFSEEAVNFPGFTCLPYADSGRCIEYVVLAENVLNPNGLVGYTPIHVGSIDITIAWLLDTNPITPSIIQAEGSDPFSSSLGNQNYFPEGSDAIHLFSDPASDGTTDNFSRFAEVYSTDAVPEPATLVLLGSGLVGIVARSRRRKQP